MRVGIDGQVFAAGVRHGFSAYVGNLTRALRDRNPEAEFMTWPCGDRSGWRLPHQLWWDQVMVPWLAWRDQVEIIHIPAFSAAIIRTTPIVLTIHDLMYSRFPRWLPTRRARWYWGRWIPFTARHATAVIAPSQATKQDLLELGGVPADRVHVIAEAVDPLFLQRPLPDEVAAYRARLGLTGPYILYVGIIDGRKDLVGLVRAYARLRTRFRKLRLVIAGTLIKGRTRVLEEIEALGLNADVFLTGHVPDSDLPRLYAGAAVFAYPSWWEGFGLPPLEAMAMGVPVISYRNSSLPEVVGEAGLLIDPPFTVDALEESLVRVLTDDVLRERMIERGEQRVKEFSWQSAADRTMAVYERCLKPA
jgi:glycosyltransferase involved in cell wall biosynthesis